MSAGAGSGAIAVRAARADDAETIAGIHRASILRGCVADYSPTQIRAWLGVLTPGVYPALIASSSVRVAVDDGAICGFSATTVGKGLINAVYVAPFAMGRGAGSTLVADAEEGLRSAGRHEAQLNSTLGAVDFYRWLGYLDVGDATNRLPGGVALACVAMRKSLT